MVSAMELMELSRQLKQERLFVNAEREQLRVLNNEVSATAENLYCLSWVTRQQKANVHRLVRAEVEAVPCCQKQNALENVKFIDGYKILTYHENKIGEALKILRNSPNMIAQLLMAAERQGGEQLHQLAHVIIAGIHGNTVMHEDEALVLQVLSHLLELQVQGNPRKMLRKDNSAFGVLFKLFIEGLFSARLFLTAALHKPVMQLLMEDEWFYDIDPQRALHRFPPAERIRRFGAPDSPEYATKTARYRDVTAQKLVTIAKRFIVSIKSAMYCFPQSLTWLLSQLMRIVLARSPGGSGVGDTREMGYNSEVGDNRGGGDNRGVSDNREVTADSRAVCADLVLALFICPAICDPEPLGIISDSPISYIARHNLMQVAQILQVLALREVDTPHRDLYDRFPQDCMDFLIDGPLSQGGVSGVSEQLPAPGHTPSSQDSQQRTAMYMTISELRMLLRGLRQHVECSESNGSAHSNHDNREAATSEAGSARQSGGAPSQLQELLRCVPSDTKLADLCERAGASTTSSNANTLEQTSSSRQRLHPTSSNMNGGSGAISGGNTPNSSPSGTPTSSRKNRGKEKSRAAPERVPEATVEPVIRVSLGVVNECPGMESEQKIVEQEAQRQRKARFNSLVPGEDDPISEDQILANEKRTRFSLSHDTDSIATSDNLEAISEAASSHSVGSDIENDNLSDMMSANVSGRGTPSISGRDTPLSQATCETDSQVEGVGPGERRAVPDLPITVHKSNREDVTDKFQKFEIERDEIKSTVSDTWSTDVLGSDSEPPEQNQMERLDEIAEEMVRQNQLRVNMAECEALETASDAWSTDVLASDTSELQIERLRELDQEEVSSVSSRSQMQEDGTDPSEDTPQPASPRSVGSGGLADLDPRGVAGGSTPTSRISVSLEDVRRSQAGRDVFMAMSSAGLAPNTAPSTGRHPLFSSRVTAATDFRLDSSYAREHARKRREKREAPRPASSGAGSSPRAIPLHAGGRFNLPGDGSPPPRLQPTLSSNQYPSSSSSTHSSQSSGSGGAPNDNKNYTPAPTFSVRYTLHVGRSSNQPGGGSPPPRLQTALSSNQNPSSSSSTHSSQSSGSGGAPKDNKCEAVTPNNSGSSSSAAAMWENGGGGARKKEFSHSAGGAFRQVSGLATSPADNQQSEQRPRNHALVAWEDTGAALADSGLISMETSAADDSLVSQSAPSSLASDLTSDFKQLKLTDQQNLNLDAKRLSSVINVFDPLSPAILDPGTNQNQGDSKSARTSNNNGDSPATASGNHSSSSLVSISKSKQSYSEQGARPKIVLNPGPNTPPRIQLSEGRDSPRGGGAYGSKGAGQSVRFDTGLVGGSEGGTDKSERGESDGAFPNSAESSPSRPEGEDRGGKKKSASGGLFKSFKDKFSKGNFQVGMNSHRASGKQRKSVKPPHHERDERSVTVLVDIEKGASGDQPSNGGLDSSAEAGRVPETVAESSDDILAKYRRPTASSSPRKSHDTVDSVMTSQQQQPEVEESQPPAYDPANVEGCKAFLDAKKKLRLVLSTADFQAIPLSCGAAGVVSGGSHLSNDAWGMGGGVAMAAGSGGSGTGNMPEKRDNELVAFLRAQLAEAINLQDKDLIARLHETIRCLAVFSNYETKRLLKSIREEHRSRSPYTSYLIRCRQGLLGTQAHLERLLNRVQRDKTIVNKYFVSVNVLLFLEQREPQLVQFIADFQTLSLSDEKTQFVEAFLNMLHEQMDSDTLWQIMREEQDEEAKVYIERYVMSHIYTHALYPNGDGDIDRDKLLNEHMAKLSAVITPNHKDLRIPAMYHYECPWPAAQNEIYMINAYKTPKDKLQCVLRCSSTIMNLLSLANEKSVPAADDFMPVLIYVLIKANPAALLSTLQYVNSFYGTRLRGEEQYWWMQFTAAVAFIHNMDYDR